MNSGLFSGLPCDGSMGEILLYYQRPQPATWVYLSSFLVMGLFFMFHRFWSMRNLDVALLLMLSPGLMMVYEGRKMRYEQSYKPTTQSAAADQTREVAEQRLLRESSRWFTDSGGGSPTKNSKEGFTISRPRTSGTEVSSAESRTNRGNSVRYVAWSPNETLLNPEPNPWYSRVIESAVGALAIQDETAPNATTAAKTTTAAWSPDWVEFLGFLWLLGVSLLLLIRLLIDATLVRRPLLEPNLSIGGLSFIGVSLFLFLMANVATSTIEEQRNQGPKLGPGYALLNALPDIQTTLDGQKTPWKSDSEFRESSYRSAIAKAIAITANLAIVLGIVAVGYWHFDDTKMGIGAATLYLLLPYTAQMTGSLQHVLPGAMLVWAVLMYRFPLISGGFLGLAAGLTYYPLFLLPLWLSFYWHRGIRRFLAGFAVTILFLVSLLFLESPDKALEHLQHMFGLLAPAMQDLQGVWGLGWSPSFRLPVLVAFCILSFSFIWWPAQKNLATLMSGTAAIMLASQFWHGFGGGLYMAWFLPLVLLTVFRPNLDDRVALEVVKDGWKRSPSTGVTQLKLAPGTDAA